MDYLLYFYALTLIESLTNQRFMHFIGMSLMII